MECQHHKYKNVKINLKTEQKRMYINFIKRLEQLMYDEKISEYKLTQELNLSKSAIWNWKQGSYPTADKLVKLADYFEVSVDYLLGRSDDIGIIETNANLTPFQNKLLTVMAALSRDDQFQVLGFAQALAK